MLPDRFRRLRTVLERRQPDLTVLMERVNKPHNFSAILRNCDAVGVLEAHAVPPAGGLPLSRDTSAGTSRWIPVRRHRDAPGAMAVLADRGFELVAAHPGPDAADYRDVDFTRPTAIVLGAELDGVSEEALSLVDRRVTIPMTGMVRSLNASVAAALLLYEAYRQRDAEGLYDEPRLPREEFDRILFEWAYPRLAARFRDRGLPYPPLGEDGEILGSLDPIRGPE
jgi:tRNA (guanosine-2'-O-)-methyltransferase